MMDAGHTFRSLAHGVEARALDLPWGNLGDHVRSLGEVLDDEAAVFLLRGDGAIGERSLEPVTTLARTVLDDPETVRGMRTLLASLDDLGGPGNLRRVTFAASDQASAGAGLLSDMRQLPDDLPAADAEAALAHGREYGMRMYAGLTGYYQGGREELVLSQRVTGATLHEGFRDHASPLPHLTPSAAARIAPHELFHAKQPHLASGDPRTPLVDASSEGAASIIGNLRAGSTLRALGREPVGLDPISMRSGYDPYVGVIGALARLGGQDLRTPSTVARLEQRMAELAPLDLVDSLVRDAARWSDQPVDAVRAAAVEALTARSDELLVHRLGALGVRDVDTSRDWMYAEARRRAIA
jgi:hypothetical protein